MLYQILAVIYSPKYKIIYQFDYTFNNNNT